MDNNRFDTLTKAMASGQSRRSMLKGLLGFGGAAVVSTTAFDDTDARRGRSTPPTTTSTTPEPACPDGATPCNSNSTGCCALCDDIDYPAVCGYDCCDSDDACCDNECCPPGEVCVSRTLDCSNNFCEERCCLDNQICDGRCCHGVCFTPLDSGRFGYDRDCCPPLPGFTFCPGTGNFAAEGLCCSGATPDCCNDVEGRPVCLTEDQCCTDAECAYLTDPTQCLQGVCNDFACEAQDVCNGEDCCEGGDNVCCPSNQECCGPLCCAAGLECCPTTGTCIDPASQCCTQQDCIDFSFAPDCISCDATNSCVAINDDGICGDVSCYRCASGQCGPDDSACDDNNICTTDSCTAQGCVNDYISNCCREQSECGQGETCYQDMCVTCETEEQVCDGRCGQLTNNCGQQFTCSCSGDETCQGTTCVICETLQEACIRAGAECGTVTSNCGAQFNCGGCTNGTCIGTSCICDASYQCSSCGTSVGGCCADVPYCNSNGQGGTVCEDCIRSISSCPCSGSGGNDNCCAGLVCVSGGCVSCVPNGQQCSASGQVCCGSAEQCTASGQTCPNPVP